MSKTKTLRTRLLYVLSVVAMLAMLIPLAASPISAQEVLVPTVTPPQAHNVIGAAETFTLTLPPGWSVISVNATNTPNGMANATVIATTGIPGPGPATATVVASGWGEAAITFVIMNPNGAISTITAFKKWGKIDATGFRDGDSYWLDVPWIPPNPWDPFTPPQNVPAVWNESAKVFEATTTVTDIVIGTFLNEDPVAHTVPVFHEPVEGAILNWFLLKDNAVTQAWLAAALAAGIQPGWGPSGSFISGINPAWYATFATFASTGTATATSTSGVTGQSTMTVNADGEEPVLVVVVPQYPNNSQELFVPLEWTKINFWTMEMEKVPQVRWAGEKIVLEKFFGTGLRPNAVGTEPIRWYGTLVRFSLENQSPGALEAIGPGGFLGNFTNSAQTVWTIVDTDGYARCMLVSEAPGEVDVDLAVYNENIFAGDDGEILEPAVIINQHGFVVFYLKLEDITLGNVQGKRAGHNSGLFEPPNPWNPGNAFLSRYPPSATPDRVAETLNVSQDTLLRALVRGWFMGDNMSVRPEREQDYDMDGSPDVLLPRGRWVLPDDWAKLAGPDWAEQRIHWDIMDNPFDLVTSRAPSVTDLIPTAVGYHGLGDYYKGTTLVAQYPVVGPFRPGLELPTWSGYEPLVTPWSMAVIPAMGNILVPGHKTVVPNGALEWWDAPMPPAKMTFEILSGNGFFKDAWKSDIYYVMVGASKYYTNPFYFQMIPAHPQIPTPVNNGGYDWNSWDLSYGPYEFWKIVNRPVPGAVPSSDSSNYPTKVQVYSDNHGEAMVWLNGNWNLDLSVFLTNGAADVPEGQIVGTSTVAAMADYPYFRKHPKLVSNNVTKTWLWGGVILGTDVVQFPFGPDQVASPMIQSVGTYTIVPTFGLVWPDEIGTSDKKLVWLWITDRDHSPAGVLDATIKWSVTGGGDVKIADFDTVHGVSNYTDPDRPGVPPNPDLMGNIDLQDGFLKGIAGTVTPGTLSTEGTSKVKLPNAVEKALFLKYYGPTTAFAAMNYDPDDFVVAAVELVSQSATIDVALSTWITSKDFGQLPGQTGTLIRTTNVNWATNYPLDDAPVYGDANANRVVDMGDVTAVERMILGMDSTYIGADANLDYSVDMGDVVTVERKILGLK